MRWPAPGRAENCRIIHMRRSSEPKRESLRTARTIRGLRVGMRPTSQHPGRGSSRRPPGVLGLLNESSSESTQLLHHTGISPVSSRLIRRPFRARSAKVRSIGSQVERLETRELLSTTPVAYPMFAVGPLVWKPIPAVRGLHARASATGVPVQQGQRQRRRRDDRDRRRLRRPGHPVRSEHLRQPVRPAQPSRSRR